MCGLLPLALTCAQAVPAPSLSKIKDLCQLSTVYCTSRKILHKGETSKIVKYYLKPWGGYERSCVYKHSLVHLLACLPLLSEKKKNQPFLPLFWVPEEHFNDSWAVQKITTACWWHHSWIHFVLSLQTLHCFANIVFTHYPIEIMASEVSHQYMPFPPLSVTHLSWNILFPAVWECYLPTQVSSRVCSSVSKQDAAVSQ